MKKVLLLVVAVFAISMGAVQAQSNVFKINVLSPIVRTGSVFYERTIAEDKSFQLGVFYTGFSIEDTKFSGYGITPEFRKYLSKSKEAPEGFYIAPFMRYQSFNMTAEHEGFSDHKDKATFKTFGGGLLVGNQWIFADRFVLDTFFGPSYNAGNIKVESGDEDSFDTGAFGGFGIRTGVSFGIKF